MPHRNSRITGIQVVIAGFAAAILATIARPSATYAGSPTADDTIVLFTPNDAGKLRLSEKEWSHVARPRALSTGPLIVIRSPPIVPGDIPTIETATPASLIVLFEPRSAPVDMNSLDVEAHKGFFSKSLTYLLRSYIRGDAIDVKNVEIPEGKFMLDISISDEAGDTTVDTYRLEVLGN
jgi:hypothetical protein